MEIILFAIFAILSYMYVIKVYSIWLRNKIPYVQAYFPYGNAGNIGVTEHIYQFTMNLYKSMKNISPLVGFHVFIHPAVVVTQLNAVKQILIKDFHLFMNRGMYANIGYDYRHSGNLFNLNGTKWKMLQAKLTVTLTAEKMRTMFPRVKNIADRLINFLDECVDDDCDLEITDMVARYTIDVIGSIALGMRCKSLKYEQANFRKFGQIYYDEGRTGGMRYINRVSFLGEKLLRKMTETSKPVTDFFIKAVKATIHHRETSSIKHNDLIDMLLQLKNNGKFDNSSDDKLEFITIDEVAAQAFAFFSTGFETTSRTLSYCLYELANNPKIQTYVREYINELLKDNQLNYDSLIEFTYLEQVINETLRKYPPAPVLFRVAIDNYTLPGTDMTIPKGTTVMIPVYAIHHDEDIYTNPYKFDPDRFCPHQIDQREVISFLPFDDGPKGCIAMQFAMMQMRLALIELISKYRFSTCCRTDIPLQFNNKSSFLSTNGIWLHIEKIV